MRGRKKILAFFFSKRKVAESSVCQNLAAILSIAESSFAESSCNPSKHQVSVVDNKWQYITGGERARYLPWAPSQPLSNDCAAMASTDTYKNYYGSSATSNDYYDYQDEVADYGQWHSSSCTRKREVGCMRSKKGTTISMNSEQSGILISPTIFAAVGSSCSEYCLNLATKFDQTTEYFFLSQN